MKRGSIFVLAFMPALCLAEPGKKKPVWTDYEAGFHCYKDMQPVVTLSWASMDARGWHREYAQIWRKGQTFGLGKRFRVESLSGVDKDGKKKPGAVVLAEILDTTTNKKFSFNSDRPIAFRTYTDEWLIKHSEKFPAKKPAVVPATPSTGGKPSN
jgi:hypothetical protein